MGHDEALERIKDSLGRWTNQLYSGELRDDPDVDSFCRFLVRTYSAEDLQAMAVALNQACPGDCEPGCLGHVGRLAKVGMLALCEFLLREQVKMRKFVGEVLDRFTSTESEPDFDPKKAN